MIIILRGLLFAFAITFNSIGLSSTAISVGESFPRTVANYGVAAYGDGHGGLIPLIAGSFYHVAKNRAYIIGIFIGKNIHPIYNSADEQIFLTLPLYQHLSVTPELHAKYDRLFVRYRPPTPLSTAPSSTPHGHQDSLNPRPRQRRRRNDRR